MAYDSLDWQTFLAVDWGDSSITSHYRILYGIWQSGH